MLSKSSQYIDELVDKLRCPISGKLFLEPVAANDGKIYENEMILNIHLHKNGISPITQQKITYVSTNVWQIKILIRMLLENYDYLKDDLYSKTGVDIPTIIPYSKYLMNIYKNNLSILCRFDKLYINDFNINNDDDLEKFSNYDRQVLKLLLSKMQDLNEKLKGGYSWYPLNKVISKCKSDVVMMFIEAGADINRAVCGGDGWTSTHQIVHYPVHTTEIRKYFIDHCDDLFKKNGDGSSIIKYIFSYRKQELAEYAINSLHTITEENKNHVLELISKYNDDSSDRLKALLNSKEIKN